VVAYVLQRINDRVFSHVDAVLSNVDAGGGAPEGE